jgi:hypothetical protein
MIDRERDLFGDLPYGGEPPSQRHSDTSRAAAARIKKRVGPLHIQLLNFLAEVGSATDEEMQDGIPMPANTQRPRRCELCQMGRIKDSGLRRLTDAKREAVVWQLVYAAEPRRA